MIRLSLKLILAFVMMTSDSFLSFRVWATSILPSQPPAIAQTPTTPGTANGPGTSAIPGIMSSPGESLPQPNLETTEAEATNENTDNALCSNMIYNLAGNDSQSLDLGSFYQCQSGIALTAAPHLFKETFGESPKQQAGQVAHKPGDKIVIEPIPENTPEEDFGRTH